MNVFWSCLGDVMPPRQPSCSSIWLCKPQIQQRCKICALNFLLCVLQYIHMEVAQRRTNAAVWLLLFERADTQDSTQNTGFGRILQSIAP